MIHMLGFNGSPRKYGNTFKMLRAALIGAELEGATTEVIHLYDLDIKPCLGCLSDEERVCKYPCVIEDDMREIYDKVLKADAIIVATPIYWFNVSGVVKNLIDRLTALENMVHHSGYSWLEGKYGGVIAVGNDGGGAQVVSNVAATMISMGMSVPPWALAYYNRCEDVMMVESSIMDAINVGRSLVLAASGMNVDRWYRRYKEDLLNRIKSKIEEEVRINYKIQSEMRKKIKERLKSLK